MPMTKGDIVTEYRQAKNKREQIKILADLNVTSQEEIIKILREAGETVGSQEQQKRVRKTKTTEKNQEPEQAKQSDGVTLTPSEAETLADFLGLTMVPAIQEKTNMIENPEYIEDLARIYRKCSELATMAGMSETPHVFQSVKRWMDKKEYVW